MMHDRTVGISEAALKDAAVKDRSGSGKMIKMTHGIHRGLGTERECRNDFLFFG